MELRVGLLGAGFIAGFHVQALARLKGARIAWICDADGKKAAALAAGVPGAKAVTSSKEMLAEKPDVVHVLLPPDAHAAAAIACLGAGAHVFVEKPLATSLQEVQAIQGAASAAGRKVGVNHNLVFNPTFAKLVEAVRARKLGELEHVAITWNVPLRQLQAGQHGHWMLRRPENILLEQAAHPLSMVQFLLGDMLRASVLTSGSRQLSTGSTFHGTWQIALELERGTAQLQLGFGREFPEIRVFAIGQDGSASADLRRSLCLVRGNSFQEPPLDGFFEGLGEGLAVAGGAAGNFAKTILGTVKARPAFDPFADSIAGSVGAFYGALVSGAEPPVGIGRGGSVIGMCEAVASQAKGSEQSSGAGSAA